MVERSLCEETSQLDSVRTRYREYSIRLDEQSVQLGLLTRKYRRVPLQFHERRRPASYTFL
jgi:hypothetical protein